MIDEAEDTGLEVPRSDRHERRHGRWVLSAQLASETECNKEDKFTEGKVCGTHHLERRCTLIITVNEALSFVFSS